jgi:hypothetical protein
MTFFSFLVSFPVSTQTVALRERERKQTANRNLFLPLRARGDVPYCRKAPRRCLSIIRLRGRVVQPKQSAEQLDVQKNVLLNGFDVSTENETIFNAIFQKKKLHHKR